MNTWKHYYNVAYLKWIFWSLVTVRWALIFLESYTAGEIRWKHVVKETGEIAWYLLLFTIFISLAHKILPRVWQIGELVPLRKYTGIFCWLIALSHATAEFIKRDLITEPIKLLDKAFSTSHAMIFGSIAFLIMLPLFITSTHFAVEKMGYTWWKRLHSLTHVAFILVALHITLIDFFSKGRIDTDPLLFLLLYFGGYTYVIAKKYMNK